MAQKKILIVEDDLNLGFLLLDFLEAEDFKVKLCRDGKAGLETIQNQSFDLCLLDVMMPKLDGFAVAKTFKKKGIKTPFIFLTAKSMQDDKLNGYSIGAEDYITKPFNEQELLCKINVVLRRQKEDPYEELPSVLNIGSYAFNHNRHELIYNSKIYRLTEKENEVLKMLCCNMNRVLKREDAVERIYGRCDYFLGRSFDVYISRLRKLLKKDTSIEIQNVYKVGFILNVNERQPSLKSNS
jgi:DNA-binding response OmpR family regulator